MKIYRATIEIVFEAENEPYACDAVSAMMSENLMGSGALLDWRYKKDGSTYSSPAPTGLMNDRYYEEGEILTLSEPDEPGRELLLERIAYLENRCNELS